MYCDKEHDDCVTISIVDNQTSETRLPNGVIAEAIQKSGTNELQYPFLIKRLDEHPVFRAHPVRGTAPLPRPAWVDR